MEKIKSWEIITNLGSRVVSGWRKIAKENKLKISVFGLPAISSYTFKTNNLINKTYITQEMLKKGFLASTNFYASTAHNEYRINLYFKRLMKFIRIFQVCIRKQKFT